ncbi:hypothetical protein SAMN05444126_14012 [Salisediminibacterium halotolerans]|uniref:Uncharacterized protein n=1 Tax=Salisediminibacterium halotolerans TaxID=517425 RepID=A0A1H9WPJ2_9BACI|nr:hypothetical protein SAMN05444126_14012 [Salisediminibacterium haloalkalitolerans]
MQASPAWCSYFYRAIDEIAIRRITAAQNEYVHTMRIEFAKRRYSQCLNLISHE